MATFQWIKKWKLEYMYISFEIFFSFVTFCFFFKNWTKQKISLSFIYPPPIFLKNLSNNKDILYLFFSINMCKNILMKKMYLCLLNIRHTKKKRRKKLAFHIASFMNTQLWTTLSLHERGCLWNRKKTKIHDAFQLLIECPKVWRTWIRENIAASPYYVL